MVETGGRKKETSWLIHYDNQTSMLWTNMARGNKFKHVHGKLFSAISDGLCVRA